MSAEMVAFAVAMRVIRLLRNPYSIFLLLVQDTQNVLAVMEPEGRHRAIARHGVRLTGPFAENLAFYLMLQHNI
ncbi:MAG: hypothetical protein WCD20_20175 [Rhodomicrobium sp.]